MFKNGIFIPRWISLSVEPEATPAGGGTDLSKVLESFNGKLAKHNNDAMQFAQQLFTENFTLREDKRKLNARVDELQGKVPADGTLVLTGDDAKAWNSIKELNLTADQIKEKLQSSSDATAELASLRRKELMREVQDVEDYKASVLSDILPGDLPIEFKDHEADGKKKKRAFIKIKENGTDKELLLSEYIEENKADYLPALKVEQATQNKFVRQESPGKAPSMNPYDRIREDAKARQEAQKTENKPLDQRLNMA